MKKKIIVIGIFVLFVGASIISSGTKNISNVEKMDYFRCKHLRSSPIEGMHAFREKYRSNKFENFRPMFDSSLNGWSITEVVSTESTGDSYNACIMCGSNGDIHVLWDDDTNYAGSGSDRDIFYKMKPSGGSWSVAEKLGFTLEGIEKESKYVDGKYLDNKTFRLLKEDWIKRKKNNK